MALLRRHLPAWLAIAAAPHVCLADEELVTLEPLEPTVVEADAEVPEHTAGSQTIRLDENPGTMTDALDAAPGVRIVRSGGEGAATQLSIQGLQGRRVATYLGPVRLDDPATGTLDLGELPAAALDEATLVRGATPSSEGALGGMLVLRPTAPARPVLRGSMRMGAESLRMLDVSAGGPIVHGPMIAGVVASARASTTSGIFEFTPVVGSASDPHVLPARNRINNDRHRAGFTLMAAGEWLGGPSVNGVIDVVTLEGGIPGFGVQPLPNAREKQVRVTTGIELHAPAKFGWRPTVQMSARHGVWRYEDRAPTGSLLTHALHANTVVMRPLAGGVVLVVGLLGWMDEARSRGPSASYDALRPMGAVHASLRSVALDGRLFMEASLRTQGWMLQTGWKDGLDGKLAVLPDVRGELRLVDGIVLQGAVTRAFRIPSLEELYRPSTARLSGNPALQPEDGFETNASIRGRMGPLTGTLGMYGARMFNQIAYVNVNAFDVKPMNVGEVWRAGGSVEGRIDLQSWLQAGAGADVNWSRVSSTQAPLPGVPLVDVRSDLLIGPPRARVMVRGMSRSGATGLASGELPIRPATRVDVGVVLRPLPATEVRALVRNITDDKSQTDLWGVPQPGREVSVHLVVDPGSALMGGA